MAEETRKLQGIALLKIFLYCNLCLQGVALYQRKADLVKEGRVSDVRKRVDYRYSVDLDSSGVFVLFWDIDTVTEEIYFRLEAEVKRADFLGFGFSDYGEAENADFVVMWTDYHGRHWFQVSGVWESEGLTRIHFHAK